jgi:xylose dehydrogenase (NAD/NADP)
MAMNNTSVRWGILGTGFITEWAFIPALQQTQRGHLVAVASRSREKAESFAHKHDIPLVFDDYTSLLASDQIDAVYNPLPNTLHAEWTAIAAEHGKHVFCEKPLAVTPAEARQMVDVCQERGVVLVEAFVFLFHPQTVKLRQLLDDGIIGDVLQVQASLTFPLPRPTDNIRLNKHLGGGSLLDAGCYPITFARFAFGEEPVAVQSVCRIDPDYGVDTRASILLTFSDDRYATVQAGFDTMGSGAALFGEQGYIDIPQPYSPKEHSHFVVHTADDEQTITVDTGLLHFTPAIEQFHDCVLDGVEPRVPAANAIGTLRIIEAVLESSLSGRRIALG